MIMIKFVVLPKDCRAASIAATSVNFEKYINGELKSLNKSVDIETGEITPLVPEWRINDVGYDGSGCPVTVTLIRDY